MCGTDALRIADGIAEKDEVAGGHIRNGYVRPLRVALRDINGTVGQRRAADGVHIRFDDEMLCRMVVSGNALCRIQLTTVALMVVETDRIELLSRRMGDRHAGAAVQSAREQNYRFFPHVFPLIRAAMRWRQIHPPHHRYTTRRRVYLLLPSAQMPPSLH